MAYLLDALYAQADEFIAIRRDIHSQPELAFEEFRTADLVAARLESYGYKVERGIGGTGVVGQLQHGTGGKSVGLRADMDALPIVETNTFGYASQRRGIMHACGHDGHTAMLLAAAKYIAANVTFSGTLNLIFQPAEEGRGGAKRMMDEGLFTKYPCDAIFAMHNAPGEIAGNLLVRDGATMASADNVTITLHGYGGHGAFPHRAADPLVAAASLVMALQTIVSRNVDPLLQAVVTVGALSAGIANNVIPQTATMKLSVRALDRDVRSLLEKRICEIANAQATSFGVRAEIEYERNYPVLVNTTAESEFAVSVARELVGNDRVQWMRPPLMASEDFAFMLEQIPGCYLYIGNGDGDSAGACMVHNPGYNFNDENIGVGSAYWALLVERYLT